MTPYLGYVTYFAFNFAPRGWQQCNGQLLQITTNQALFAVLGVTYGGDGRVTFGLPDLRGRAIVGYGTGGGGTYTIGQKIGTEGVTLATANMAQHTHTSTIHIPVSSAVGSDNIPAGEYLSSPANGGNMFAPTPTTTPTPAYGTMAVTIGNVGTSVPVSVLNPYQALNACIAITGIFPSRN